MRRWLPHFGIVLGVAIAVYALFFAGSEEDRIRAQLETLEETVAVGGEENPVLRAARVKKSFEALFVKTVHFEIPELAEQESGRRELVRLATIAPQLYQSARIDLAGLRIDVDADESTAVAHGEAVLVGARRSGEPERDTRTVSIRFDRIDGEWMIVSLSASLPRESGSPGASRSSF